MCVSASVKTKRQTSEYFIPVRCLSPCAASQCWPLQHRRMHSESNKDKQIHTTHTCSVSRRSCRLRGSRLQRFRAGATTVQTHLPSGSEAVLYTCQPSSEPGYIPCTQIGSVLMKSLQEYHVNWASNRGEGQQFLSIAQTFCEKQFFILPDLNNKFLHNCVKTVRSSSTECTIFNHHVSTVAQNGQTKPLDHKLWYVYHWWCVTSLQW